MIPPWFSSVCDETDLGKYVDKWPFDIATKNRTGSLLGKQIHIDSFLSNLAVSARLWQTHCLVSLLLGLAQGFMYIQGRGPWEVRLREVLLHPSLTDCTE